MQETKERKKEFKADHFENIEELVKTCKMWVTDDDYDAYCRFFDMGAMEEILNLISNLQKEVNKKDEIINKAIEEIEIFRQHFSEDLQPDFIIILEILKDKKVINW